MASQKTLSLQDKKSQGHCQPVWHQQLLKLCAWIWFWLGKCLQIPLSCSVTHLEGFIFFLNQLLWIVSKITVWILEYKTWKKYVVENTTFNIRRSGFQQEALITWKLCLFFCLPNLSFCLIYLYHSSPHHICNIFSWMGEKLSLRRISLM